MNHTKRSVTIQDVARAAGVSVSTVSRVLNNKEDVAQATAARVRRVIGELGYTSSLAARSMRSRRTGVIGAILPSLEESYCIQVIRGINRVVVEHGYDLIVYTSGEQRDENQGIWEQINVARLNGTVTDGIILVTPYADHVRTGYPLVAVDPQHANADYPAVLSTNHAGMLEAMAYLCELGHRRIGYINGRSDLQGSVRRLQGYRDGLQAAGIPFDPELVQDGDFTLATAVRCAHRLLDRPDRPTAIVAANDVSAFGVLDAAAELAIDVPAELSVVGFDNIPEAALCTPPLTTVDQSIQIMGKLAAELLIDQIRGRTVSETVRKVPTRLMVRQSCRAVSAKPLSFQAVFTEGSTTMEEV